MFLLYFRNFPNCLYGDKCMYVHPTCKFDTACTRPNCIYSHTAHRPPPHPVPLIMPIKGKNHTAILMNFSILSSWSPTMALLIVLPSVRLIQNVGIGDTEKTTRPIYFICIHHWSYTSCESSNQSCVSVHLSVWKPDLSNH